jgi:hypothetical protein
MNGTGSRRYVVKEVVSTPGWTGVAWAVGFTRLPSAEVLSERKVAESKADRTDQGAAILLIDRVERRVIGSSGSRDPVKTARYFGEDVE